MFLSVSKDSYLASLRKRVRDRDADSMQSARYVVHAVAPAPELAAGVQHAERHLDRGLLLLLVHGDRNSPAFIVYFYRTVLAHRDGDALAEAGERLVHRVVDRFLHDVQRVDGVGIHPRHAAHGLEALERLDRGYVVDLLPCH